MNHTEELCLAQKMNLGNCTIAIEGFGNVGSWVGTLFSGLGAKVVAVSTTEGGLYNSAGLDMSTLCKVRKAEGDRCVVNFEDADKIRNEELLRLPADLLIPCAFSWSINRSNADHISAKMIVCGANNPVTDRAKAELAKRSIHYFPDFVSNSGGVMGSMLERSYLKREKIINFINRRFRSRVKSLIRRADTEGRLYETIAKEIAAKNHKAMKSRKRSLKSRSFAPALKLNKNGFVPESVIKLFAPAYIKSNIRM